MTTGQVVAIVVLVLVVALGTVVVSAFRRRGTLVRPGPGSSAGSGMNGAAGGVTVSERPMAGRRRG